MKARTVKRLLLALVAAAVVVGGAAAVERMRSPEQQPRPELQRLLDELVADPGRAAPGATAYVAGPKGTWAGAAGSADVEAGEPMRPDARMRLESVSKLWTAALLLRLEEQGQLAFDDTVGELAPDLLPSSPQVTLRQLLNHTSGLVDNNDISVDPSRYLAQVDDPALRAELRQAGERLVRDPDYEFPVRLMIRFVAALPLRSEPGAAYHYSNVGYQVAGLIAERVTGETLARLHERELLEPLGLERAAYDPRSQITGTHARGYALAPDGALTDTTRRVADLGANGGVVSDARDEGRFLAALFGGELLSAASLRALEQASPHEPYGLGTGIEETECAGTAYSHNGGGAGFTTSVYATGDGSRVAVVLLNGRAPDGYSDQLAKDTALRLLCLS